MLRPRKEEDLSGLNAVASRLLQEIRSAGLEMPANGKSERQQLIDFLTVVDDKFAIDMLERNLSVPYIFGPNVLKQYPVSIATRDVPGSIGPKLANLRRIGVKTEVVKKFEELANPEWGYTLRGVENRPKGKEINYLLDRDSTYLPFRQRLELVLNTNGVKKFEYEFVLYPVDTLYFWQTESVGVFPPEFKADYNFWCSVIVSGRVNNGKLEFSNLKFRHATPNHRVSKLKGDEIVIQQKNAALDTFGMKHTDYKITSAGMEDLLKYIRLPGHMIDTNPLFPFEVIRNRKSKV